MSAPSTAESALRSHVRAERIKLPGVCYDRSLPWIVAFCGRPFAWIAGALVLAGSGTPDWIVGPVAALCLLLAQRHFQTLVHDASHGFYHRKGPINDLLANWLAAGWIGMTVENYRRIHFPHHAHNGSAEDPEHVSFATVTEAGGLLRMVVRYACLLEAFGLVRKYYGGEREPQRAPCGVKEDQRQQPSAYVHTVATQLLLGSACLALDVAAVYPLWLYLAVSWSPLLSRLRFLVEHPGESDLTVTTRSTLWERPLFAPLNFNFHFEHHCWPGVPPYRLQQAHRHLRDQGFYDRHPEYANESFIGALVHRQQTQRAAGEVIA